MPIEHAQLTYIVYLVGPVTGKSLANSEEWREEAKKLFADSPQIVSFSPMRKRADLADEIEIKDTYAGVSHALGNSKMILVQNRFDIQRATALLVYVKGTKKRVSIGTVMEISWAWLLEKPIMFVTDMIPNPDKPDELIPDPTNPHNNALIREMASYVFADLSPAVAALKVICSP